MNHSSIKYGSLAFLGCLFLCGCNCPDCEFLSAPGKKNVLYASSFSPTGLYFGAMGLVNPGGGYINGPHYFVRIWITKCYPFTVFKDIYLPDRPSVVKIISDDYLIVGFDSGFVRVYSLINNGREAWYFIDPEAHCTSIATIKADKFIFSDSKNRIFLVDIISKQKKLIHSFDRTITTMQFEENSETNFYVGDDFGGVWLIESDRIKIVSKNHHSGSIISLKFSNNPKQLWSICDNGIVNKTYLDSNCTTNEIFRSKYRFQSADIDSSCSFAAVTGGGSSIDLINLSTGKISKSIALPYVMINSVLIEPSGNKIAFSMGASSKIGMWVGLAKKE